MQSTFLKFASIFFLVQLLVACGSERDTAFNPSGNNNSSSAASIGATVTVNEIYRFNETEPEQPEFLDVSTKQIHVITTEDEFEFYWDMYKQSDSTIPTDLDFERMQVVVLDLGNIGTCSQITNYRNVRANEYSNNTVLVSFNYKENQNTSATSSSSSSSSSCSDVDELAKKRPFYFYSIESRKKLLIDENVTYENL